MLPRPVQNDKKLRPERGHKLAVLGWLAGGLQRIRRLFACCGGKTAEPSQLCLDLLEFGRASQCLVPVNAHCAVGRWLNGFKHPLGLVSLSRTPGRTVALKIVDKSPGLGPEFYAKDDTLVFQYCFFFGPFPNLPPK